MKRNKEIPIVLVVLFLVSTAGVVEGANIISNPGFELGTTSWNFYASGGGTFTTPSPGFEGTKYAKLVINNSGTNIQLYQEGLTLEANTLYRLSFMANSTTGHDVTVNLIGIPYAQYGLSYTANLGTSVQTFQTEFTTKGFSGTVSNGRLQFWLSDFARAGDVYYIDAIVLEKAFPLPPIIKTQPSNQTVNEGQNATFSVVATGTAPLRYQWQKNGTNIPGATSASYMTLPTVMLDNLSTFRVNVTNDKGSNMSKSATLTVISSFTAPTITTQPLNQTVTVGQSATFSVVATGTAPLRYQWQKNGTNIPGATSASYTTPPTTTSDNLSTYRVNVTNDAGSVMSKSATLTVSTSCCDGIEARLAALENRVTNLETENTALKSLLANVSRNGSDIYIDGANLHIRDGSNDTYGSVNGLGNLIIGYNELRPPGCLDICLPENNRTGSHNLILGLGNNYESFGGLVVGAANEISGPYASVSGGYWNTASGGGSSVSGGYWNTAIGSHSSVSGGSMNTASGDYSSVSGGGPGGYYLTWTRNIASGDYSSISGGRSNIASGDYSSVSGGEYNTASNYAASVSGGNGNNASGEDSSVSGGSSNTASVWVSSVSGGIYNIAVGSYSSVSGGYNNTASGGASSVSGGEYNTASSDYSSVSGGMRNTASGSASSVSGGNGNTASGGYSSVSGGGAPIRYVCEQGNEASGEYSSVSGGLCNDARGYFSSVSGGKNNTASTDYSSVSGGTYNTASGSASSVSGGYLRNATGIYNWTAGGLSQDQ